VAARPRLSAHVPSASTIAAPASFSPGALLAKHLDGYNLRLEVTGSLRAAEPLLRAQRPAILHLAGDLEFLHQIFGVPAGSGVGEGVVEAVAQHAVVELAVAQPVAPPPARDEVRRLIHVLHAARHRNVDIAERDLLRC
jgi:hypothetical protein